MSRQPKRGPNLPPGMSRARPVTGPGGASKTAGAALLVWHIWQIAVEVLMGRLRGLIWHFGRKTFLIQRAPYFVLNRGGRRAPVVGRLRNRVSEGSADQQSLIT